MQWEYWYLYKIKKKKKTTKTEKFNFNENLEITNSQKTHIISDNFLQNLVWKISEYQETLRPEAEYKKKYKNFHETISSQQTDVCILI